MVTLEPTAGRAPRERTDAAEEGLVYHLQHRQVAGLVDGFDRGDDRRGPVVLLHRDLLCVADDVGVRQEPSSGDGERRPGPSGADTFQGALPVGRASGDLHAHHGVRRVASGLAAAGRRWEEDEERREGGPEQYPDSVWRGSHECRSRPDTQRSCNGGERAAERLDAFQHAIEMQRLGEMLAEAVRKGALAIVVLSVARDGDERRVREFRDSPEEARQLVAIHRRQPDVEEGDVGHECLDELQRARAIAHGAHLVARHAERPLEELGRFGVVVDDEHTAHRAAALRSPARVRRRCLARAGQRAAGARSSGSPALALRSAPRWSRRARR